MDFERFCDEDDVRLYAGGTRANDVQVRLKYAGLPSEVVGSVEEAVRKAGALPKERPLYVLANYSALFPARAELERLGERHG